MYLWRRLCFSIVHGYPKCIVIFLSKMCVVVVDYDLCAGSCFILLTILWIFAVLYYSVCSTRPWNNNLDKKSFKHKYGYEGPVSLALLLIDRRMKVIRSL